MAKEYTVELGGKVRKLRFTQADGRALYQQFQKPLHDLFWDDVLGVADETFGKRVNPVALHASLFLALKHDVPALNEQTLDDWIDKHIAGGGTIAPLMIAIMSTATMAGITNGVAFDFEARVQATIEDLGKVPPPNPAESSEPPTES